MDDMSGLVIDSVFAESGKFSPNHYNVVISPERQIILSKLRTLESRAFKAVKKIMEMSGHFLRIKENVYRDMRHTDVYSIVVRNKQ